MSQYYYFVHLCTCFLTIFYINVMFAGNVTLILLLCGKVSLCSTFRRNLKNFGKKKGFNITGKHEQLPGNASRSNVAHNIMP